MGGCKIRVFIICSPTVHQGADSYTLNFTTFNISDGRGAINEELVFHHIYENPGLTNTSFGAAYVSPFFESRLWAPNRQVEDIFCTFESRIPHFTKNNTIVLSERDQYRGRFQRIRNFIAAGPVRFTVALPPR